MSSSSVEEHDPRAMLVRHEAALGRMGGRLDRVEQAQAQMGERLDGMADQMAQTTEALRANTTSNERLGASIDRLSDRMQRQDERLDEQVAAHAAHLVDAERDKRGLARTALAAWAWLVGAVLAVAGWAWTIIDPALARALHKVWQAVSASSGAAGG